VPILAQYSFPSSFAESTPSASKASSTVPLTFSVVNNGIYTAYLDYHSSATGTFKSISCPPGKTTVQTVYKDTFNSPSSFWRPFSWAGLTAQNPVQATAPEGVYTVFYKWSTNGPTATVSVTVPAASASVTYGSGNGGHPVFFGTAFVANLTAGVLENIVPVAPPVPKIYGSGVFFINNTTGIEHKGRFGDEDVTLKPGYNAIPFTGEIDSNGFPKAVPANWALTKTTGPDGQVYWSGRISPPIEAGGAPVWAGVGGIAILPGASGSGPVIKLPNASNPALYDYVTLPAGMTRGSNNTLPGGMTAGSPGLPPGMTGGSAGALPNGTLSGGTAYLPPNVSPGTTSNVFVGGPTPGGFPGVNGTGVTATTSGPSTQGESGGYIPGASMDGMLERGVAQGQAAARKITTEFSDAANAVGGRAGAIYGSGTRGLAAGYWGVGAGAAAVGGADRSWLSVTIPIAQYSIPLTIPPYWIDLIRSILVWGVKIWFVVAVLKLLMR
jgi:hypothetical protein